MNFVLTLMMTALSLLPLNGLIQMDKYNAYENDHKTARSSKKADLVDTAISAGQFTTLVAAVKAAGLVDVLKGDGPYTVFAPSDEAFAKIPAHTLKALLKPENRDKLVKILTYHVVPGKLEAEDVVSLSGAKTVQGGRLKFRQHGNTVRVNNANVLKTDINTSNGIIHVIDTVLMPE